MKKLFIILFFSSLLLYCSSNKVTTREDSKNVAKEEFVKYCKSESVLESEFLVKEYFNEDGVDYIFEAVENGGSQRTIIIYVKEGRIVDQIKTSEK